MNFGQGIYKFRWAIVLLWSAATVGLLIFAPPEWAGEEPASFLPESVPSRRAEGLLNQAFPDNSGLSQAMVVFERREGKLRGEDVAVINSLAKRLRTGAKNHSTDTDLAGITVLTPQDLTPPALPLMNQRRTHSPFISPDGRAALVQVNIPANFITKRSDRIVRRIRAMLADEKLPDGLAVAVTGSSGYGSDYALAAKRSHVKTLYVTLAAIIIILLVVYRAPLAAAVPLVAISIAAVVALRTLNVLTLFGMHVGTAEVIFVVVLLYGAGTDYSLLLISRYREFLRTGMAPPQALAAALNATGRAILASAGTDTAGLLMLSFAEYSIFRTTGMAVALALSVALLSAVTLVPALLGIFGRRVFWPMRTEGPDHRWRIWPVVARFVVARAAFAFVVILLLLVAPAIRGAKQEWVYDTMAELKGDYGAPRGAEMARRHWPVGEVSPVVVLVQAEQPVTPTQWLRTAAALTGMVERLPGVQNVRSYARPTGNGQSRARNLVLSASAKVQKAYLGAEGRSMRLTVVLDHPPLTKKAMDAAANLKNAVQQMLANTSPSLTVHLSGATAEVMDIRSVTRRDFHRVAVLVLVVIFVIVAVCLRQVILPLFMVLSSILSYLATLGIAHWVFAGLLGEGGLDWKVQVFLFVVMMAVGVDYNIFLAARLREERHRLGLTEAIRAAVVHTGPVISSCGLIMAATLGSLMVGDLALLQQLGFAFAVGMLIDTFIVRPVLLPSFVMLAGRRAAKSARH